MKVAPYIVNLLVKINIQNHSSFLGGLLYINIRTYNMRNLTSIIKWRTGVPVEMGKYLIVTDEGVNSMYFHPKEAVDLEYFERFVTMWCKLTDINPHEEK